MRYPPTWSFRGRASALNLIRYLPAIFGRTSSAVAFLLIRVAELEDDFGITHRKAIDVADASAKDERIVVETEVRSVAEDDFPELLVLTQPHGLR